MLDVLYAVGDSRYEEFKRPEYAPPPLLKRMVVSGQHGRKTGRGYYEYAPARWAAPVRFASLVRAGGIACGPAWQA